jgi:hypothetical protein
VIVYDDEGNEVTLPTKWEVCSACGGEGKSSAYLGAFTPDELDREGEDFVIDYWNGAYDRECEICNGRTTVRAVDEDNLTMEQAVLWGREQQAYAEALAEEAAERRAGC